MVDRYLKLQENDTLILGVTFWTPEQLQCESQISHDKVTLTAEVSEHWWTGTWSCRTMIHWYSGLQKIEAFQLRLQNNGTLRIVVTFVSPKQ